MISTHPIQYHAPVYRMLQAKFGIPVTAIYRSDFSITGYEDKEFNATFAWDVDLLSGYQSIFLSKVRESLQDVLQRVKPKAVLLIGYSSRFYRMAFYHVLKEGYPVLFRGETTDHAKSRNFLKAWIRDHILRAFYKKCYRLLYIGQYSYKHFKRLGVPDEKLIFSPYCIDASSFKCDEDVRLGLRQAVRQSMGIAETKKVLLFSGKLSFRKGADLFLKAVKGLPLKITEDIEIVFLGSGELKDMLEGLAQTVPQLKVHFVGFKNQSQLSPYYHAADLLILPSRHSETWGLVVNEALQHGLPCVVSEAVGCAPDLIEPGVTGEICKVASIESMASAIQRALSLINRLDIRNECRRKVSGYSIEKAAEGIAKAYKSIL